MPDVTYHGVPKSCWDTQDMTEPYVPADFEREGFIHCTDGREAISTVLTQYYRDDPGDCSKAAHLEEDIRTTPK